MARGWFVVQLYTGYEKTVYNSLLRKKETSSVLHSVLLDVRVPEEEYTTEIKGKKVVKKRLIYPGYILVELDLPEDETEWKKVYAEIRSIAGVGIFLTSGGGNKRPVPLSFDEVRSVFEKTGEITGEVDQGESTYEIDEVVRVTSGAFKGFEGKVEEIYNDRSAVIVRVEIFGRLTPVELTFNQIQKI